MEIRVRHLISTSGRLPVDPVAEPASGVVGAVLGLTAPQSRLGYALEVWGWNDATAAKQTQWLGTRLWSSPGWGWAKFARWDFRWLAPVWRHALTQPPVDVLHTHVDPNLLYIPKARVRLHHIQTPVPDPFPPAYRRLLRRADAVICCSNFIRTRFLSAGVYPADRTFVVHNGADLNAFGSEGGSDLRTQWGCDDEDLVILYTGAVVQEKGVAHLIRAFAQVQAEAPNAALVIAGGSRLWAMPGGNPIGDAYEAEVRRLAQGLNVRFLGSVPRGQMPDVYRATDLVAVPSVWDDPHPTVVCEAMAAGRPTVASRAGGITETVDHGRTGYLVSPGEEAQLASAILSLAKDAHLRRQMGQAARERAQLFTWDASAQRLNTIYQELLSKSERQRSFGSSMKVWK